ncbi:MAG: Rieske (2Fe-2S) protein [Gemmatimonadetes bacterium]|nr:Rieske (2Fe-2S) protein [Gemmatimonadota bacterium]
MPPAHGLGERIEPVSGSSRRRFFLQIWQGLFGGAVAAAGASLLATCARPSASPSPRPGVAVDVSDLPGGSTKVAPAPGPDGAPILIVHQSAGGYHALSLQCTHEGCPVNATPLQGILTCPCHGSRFDLEGRVVQGPAEFPLGRYDSAYDAKHRRLLVRFLPQTI